VLERRGFNQRARDGESPRERRISNKADYENRATGKEVYMDKTLYLILYKEIEKKKMKEASQAIDSKKMK